MKYCYQLSAQDHKHIDNSVVGHSNIPVACANIRKRELIQIDNEKISHLSLIFQHSLINQLKLCRDSTRDHHDE